MKKKVLSVLLAAAMVSGLAACGSSAPAEKPAESGAESTESGEAATLNFANPDGSPLDLVMSFATFTGAPNDTQEIEDALNAIIEPKLGIHVNMTISDWGSFRQTSTLSLAGGEQIDLLSTITLGYPTLVAQGYLLDLEEDDLLANYGPDIVDAIGQEYVDACRVDGVLYGVPNNRDFAQGRGCMSVATKYLDQIGWPYDPEANINQISMEDLQEMMKQLHEQITDVETMRPAANGLVQFTNYDFLGGNNFGVLENYGETTEVVNLFESQDYIDFVHMMNDWNKAGYIGKDAATDDTAVSVLIAADSLVSYQTAGKPGSRVQESSVGVPCTIFQCKEDFLSSSGCSGYPWAIPITTVNAEAAMALLNELYTNVELADLIVYGIEGKHYVICEDGLLDPTQGTNSDGYATLPWLYPNQFNCTVTEGNPATLWDEIITFNSEAKKSAAVGFSFDATPVQNELTACTNAYNEFSTDLEYGFAVDCDATLKALNDKLYASGLQKIIDEKQAQLDAWLEKVSQ